MNLSTFSMKLIASAVLVIAGSASAATYTNVPSGANGGLPFAYFGNAANPSGDSPKVGEVFAVSSAETLSSFSFYALGNSTPTVQLNVALWNNGINKSQPVNTVGAPLLTASSTSSKTYNAASNVTEWKFDNLGLNLNANTKYIAYLSSTDASVTGIQLSRTATTNDASGFGVGFGYLSTIPGNGWQLPFNGFQSLQYSAITAAVPEPESYALLLAGMGLIGAAVKRRKAKQA